MKLVLYICYFLLVGSASFGQVKLKTVAPPPPSRIVVLEHNDDYFLSQQMLVATGSQKSCLLFNLIPRSRTLLESDKGPKPLVVFKVFLDNLLEKSLVKVDNDSVRKCLSAYEMLREAERVVSTHRYLDAITLVQREGEESTFQDVAVIVKQQGGYYRIKGITICQFFYTINFPQSSIRQSNLTFINTSAIIGDHYYFHFQNDKDSIAINPHMLNNDPRFDFQGKIFLVRKNADSSFRFYRKHFLSLDLPFRDVEEFDYLPGHGIVSFASKIPFISPINGLRESNEFYRFKPIK